MELADSTPHDTGAAKSMSPAAAKSALAILEMQGYVKPGPKGEWMPTPAGESVYGASEPT